MMHRVLSLALTVVALMMFTVQAALAQDKEHDGKVVKAGDGKLTMVTKGSKHTHEIGKEVKITLDNKPAKLEDLKEGYHIIVTMRGDDVVKIVAHSKAM
jgi:hypothetical protein